MTDFKIGGPYPTGARNRSVEPLQLGDTSGEVSPVFTEVTRMPHPGVGEVTFLPGEAKPRWVVELQQKEATAAAEPAPGTVPPKRGNKAVTAK